jgi:peptidoglycan-N-acetylglucosamine deacetylase
MSFTPCRAWLEAARPALLTFDDGPLSPASSMVLDVLARFDIRAMFFVVGAHVEQDDGRAVLERIIAAGHPIGNHSYSHAMLTRLSVDEIVQDLSRAQTIIESAGVTTRLFRPPYGEANGRVADAARALGFTGIGWTADTEDWNAAYQPDAWIERGIAALHHQRGDIVLLHDRPTTAQGLARFIERLMALGYTFPPLFDDTSAEGDDDGTMWTEGPMTGWQKLTTLPVYRPAAA